jgi:putative oxidoreductase
MKNYLIKLNNLLTVKSVGWGLTIIVSLMLGMGGVSKLMGTEEMVNNFTFMNLLPYIEIIGLVEIAGVILLLIPKTSLYGAVILGSVMTAAVALHLSLMGGDKIAMPLMIGTAAWLSYFLRNK